jgi:hypothetical protein
MYKVGNYICSCSTGIKIVGIFRKLNSKFRLNENDLIRYDVKKNIDLGHIKYVGPIQEEASVETLHSEAMEIIESDIEAERTEDFIDEEGLDSMDIEEDKPFKRKKKKKY